MEKARERVETNKARKRKSEIR